MKFKILFLTTLAVLILAGCMPVARRHTASGEQIKIVRGSNYCNIYVIQEMSKLGIPMANTTANGLDRYLKKSDNWVQLKRKKGKLDHKTAYRAARENHPVLVAYNSGNSRSGHIAVVHKDRRLYWSQDYNAYVPYVRGSLRGSRPAIMPLSHQFARAKETRMNYFIYVGDDKKSRTSSTKVNTKTQKTVKKKANAAPKKRTGLIQIKKENNENENIGEGNNEKSS
jgi:hypothetical protein